MTNHFKIIQHAIMIKVAPPNEEFKISL